MRHPCLAEDGTYEHLVPEGEATCARCLMDSSDFSKLSPSVKQAEPSRPGEAVPPDLTAEAEGEQVPIEPVQLALLQRLDLIIGQNRVTHLVLGGIMAAVHGDQPKLPPEIWKAIGCTPKEDTGIVLASELAARR